MGMDVFGIDPKINEYSVKPTEPEWSTCTTEERDAFFEADRQYSDDNPGVYFRANVWAWRPILDMIYAADERHELGIPEQTLTHMGFNDGAGLDNQADCDALADAMEDLLKEEGDVITWDCGDPDFKDAYRVGKSHVQDFIGFLRECGGFSVC